MAGSESRIVLRSLPPPGFFPGIRGVCVCVCVCVCVLLVSICMHGHSASVCECFGIVICLGRGGTPPPPPPMASALQPEGKSRAVSTLLSIMFEDRYRENVAVIRLDYLVPKPT